MGNSKPNRRQSASDIIYEELKRKIVQLEYEPGLTLNEEQLSRETSVSRTPLRQALFRLELEGLVVKLSTGRMFVANLSVQEAEEIFKTRAVLEGLTAREATQNMTEEHIFHLEDIMELMHRSASNDRKMDTIHYGGQFHQILYEPSQNQTAVQFLKQLNNRLERYRRIGGSRNPQYVPMVPVEEHQNILNAIKEKNADKAEWLMRAHINRSLQLAKDTLKCWIK